MAKIIKLEDHHSTEILNEKEGHWATEAAIGEEVGAKNCNMFVISKKPGLEPMSVMHYHPKREEFFVVLEGSAKAIVNDAEIILEPGMIVFVPAGEKQYLHLRAIPMGDKVFRILEVGSPMKEDGVYLKEPGAPRARDALARSVGLTDSVPR